MTIDDLKNAKLSATTQGYLAIYLQLSDIYGTLSDVTSIAYNANVVDIVNQGCCEAISNAQDEIMKLASQCFVENLCTLDNHTEL